MQIRIPTALKICALALCAAAAVQSAVCAQEDKKSVVIGLIDTFSPEFYINTFSPTVDHLIETLPEFEFNIVEIDPQNIESEIKKYHPDFLISSASTYVSLMDSVGAHQVATKESKNSPDVTKTVASTFIVPVDSPIQSITEARGKTVAVSSKDSFDGWLIAQGEVAKYGDPEKFFKATIETNHGFPDVSALVKVGAAEIGVLAICELERLLAAGVIKQGEFKVLGPKSKLGSCFRSTEAYPDAVFSSLSNVDSSTSRKVTVSLLTMPTADYDFQWTVANDFVPTYQLLKDLKIGPFAPVNVWSFEAFISHYKYQILLGLFLLAMGALHSFYINLLVRKRTAELRNAMISMEKFHKEALSNKQKLDSLERINIVSQLSSMFAHEIKQPITNISYYIGTLLMLLKKEGKDDLKAQKVLDAMQSEVERSVEIVDQVRGYAKKRQTEKKLCDLKDIVYQAVKFLPISIITNKVKDSHLIYADPFEIEFIISNFLKNAIAATKDVKKPKIVVSVKDENDRWKVTVSDNGPEISDETLARIGELGHTTKSDGLGWGISIASAMAEANAGHIQFEKNPLSGLSASLWISKAKGENHG